MRKSLKEQILDTLLEYREVVLTSKSSTPEDIYLDALYGADIIVAQIQMDDRKRGIQ